MQHLWGHFPTGELSKVCALMRRYILVGIILTKKRVRRLHMETNCGRHRNWHCALCGPNLLTADAYEKHMETEHKPVPEDEVDFIMPTVVVTLKKNLNYTSVPDFSEKGTNLDDSSEDPLLLMLKDENHFLAETENVQNTTNEDVEDISNCLSAGTSTET